jgi:hypothetical protein
VLLDTLGSECGLGHGLVFADAQLLPMSPCFEVVQWADDNEDGDGRATRLADEVDFALEASTKWHICEPPGCASSEHAFAPACTPVSRLSLSPTHKSLVRVRANRVPTERDSQGMNLLPIYLL